MEIRKYFIGGNHLNDFMIYVIFIDAITHPQKQLFQTVKNSYERPIKDEIEAVHLGDCAFA